MILANSVISCKLVPMVSSSFLRSNVNHLIYKIQISTKSPDGITGSHYSPINFYRFHKTPVSVSVKFKLGALPIVQSLLLGNRATRILNFFFKQLSARQSLPTVMRLCVDRASTLTSTHPCRHQRSDPFSEGGTGRSSLVH